MAQKGGTFREVLQSVDSLEVEAFPHSTLNERERRDSFREAHKVISALLGKIVGSSKVDKVNFLLQHVKRLFPKGGHLKCVVDDLKSLKDYSTLRKNERKTYGRNFYKTFDVMIKKISGSNTHAVHIAFLSSRFMSMHKRELIQQPS